MSTKPSRRQVLEVGIAGGLWLSSGCSRRAPAAAPAAASENTTQPDLEVSLKSARARVAVDGSGRSTNVLRFEGKRLAGSPGSFDSTEAGYLGPTFRLRRGQRVRVNFENALDEASVIHWHGLDVSEENDGHPRFAIAGGTTRQYDFKVENRPGTYWYHPHPEGRTGYQVHAGLAGFFLVTDEDDVARGLPTAEFDLPLVIQDRILDGASQLVYAPNPMLGFLGDRILVNGRADASFEVKAGTYRLRLLNGSNARIYKLAWSDGSPMRVIGTDGGLVAAPIERPAVLLAPGERIELWADFGAAPRGDSVWLESRAFSIGGGMMGGGMMGMIRGGGASAAPPNGAALRICRFAISGKGPRLPLPRHLSPPDWRSPAEVANFQNPRRFAVSMAMMRWVLNGGPFDMNEIAANERIKLGATEDWEFSNPGGMMTTAHPIHVHGGQFQIVQRTVAPSWRGVAATMDDALVDEGWKDTFLLRPGEQVRIRVRFGRHAGLFLYHCHNLEHEDMGMMRNFRIEG